tara:strand:+ start:458 stop:1285 length:828 start_codon:yes stop_codon:yes gene_type:complete
MLENYIVKKNILSDKKLIDLKSFVNNFAYEKILIWKKKGLIAKNIKIKKENLENTFYYYWKIAGKPRVYKNAKYYFYNKTIYNLITDKKILKIVSNLLKSNEICLFGDFNIRFLFPKEKINKTKWHQDFGSLKSLGEKEKNLIEPNTNVVTMWLPLTDIKKKSGALSVNTISKYNKSVIKPGKKIWIPKKISNKLKSKKILLNKKDLLFFKFTTLHKSCKNLSDKTRWAIDIRFEDFSRSRYHISKKNGIILKSKRYKKNSYLNFISKKGIKFQN